MPQLFRHPLVEQLGRYGATGVAVAIVYVLGTILLAGPVGLPIQLAVLIAYVVAVVMHFTMQRHFVFAHVETFHLPVGAQIRNYLVIGGAQYAFTVAAITFLPDLIGTSEIVVYLSCVVVCSAVGFLALRTRVFHASSA